MECAAGTRLGRRSLAIQSLKYNYVGILCLVTLHHHGAILRAPRTVAICDELIVRMAMHHARQIVTRLAVCWFAFCSLRYALLTNDYAHSHDAASKTPFDSKCSVECRHLVARSVGCRVGAGSFYSVGYLINGERYSDGLVVPAGDSVDCIGIQIQLYVLNDHHLNAHTSTFLIANGDCDTRG